MKDICSLWKAETDMPSYPALKENIKTDVLIIGGGITGILCALKLKDRGVDCIIAEAQTVCGGVTGNTTAKLTVQHGLIYKRLINTLGTEKAALYYAANNDALCEYKRLCLENDCDFAETDSYVYSLSGRRKIENELKALEKLKIKAEFSACRNLPFETCGAVKFKNQAQFNPLKFLKNAANGLKIYENTRVLKIKGNTAVTKNGNIKAEKIIVATHFPFENRHGSYFLKMYQQRSYVAAFKNAPDLTGMYIDENKNGLSFRNSGEYLLIGGASHRTGKPCDGWDTVRSFVKSNYPRAEEKYRWATEDCITLDGVPYIGNYSALTPDLYVATGYNKWGMTSSMAAAQLLSDLITGRQNPYSRLFSPSRSIIRKQLLFNSAAAAAGLVNFKTKRCPHLGCVLERNPHEHTWDCPCHGSRFTESGRLLNDPANRDLH